MGTDAYLVTLQALSQLGEPFEVRITRQWLSKYVRRGLLPPQSAPGLGRGKGRSGLYSVGLAQQLVPLLQARKRHGKNLDAIGWELWWLGYYAAPEYWRPKLFAVATKFNRVREFASSYQAGESNAVDIFEQAVVELRDKRDTGRLVGAVKRHAPDQLPDFLTIMLSTVSGDYVRLSESAHDEYAVEQLEKLFGRSLSIPKRDAQITADNHHFQVSVEGFDEQLSVISNAMQVDCEKLLSETSDQEIVDARQELAIFMFGISAVERANLATYGTSSGAKPIVWMNEDADSQATALIGWLIRRRELRRLKYVVLIRKIHGAVRAASACGHQIHRRRAASNHQHGR